MKKYNFLFKPIFYIFSLIFATWLVIKIEEISPSDFSNHETNILKTKEASEKFIENKIYLLNLFKSYKSGIIDSIDLDHKVTVFLRLIKGSI